MNPDKTSAPPDADAQKVLDITSLTMSFGGLRAVDNVDLDVKEGEIVALIGPNGAGKNLAPSASSRVKNSLKSAKSSGTESRISSNLTLYALINCRMKKFFIVALRMRASRNTIAVTMCCGTIH